jgi:hypothetical protein
MSIDLIFPMIILAGAVVLLSVWKKGRAVAVAAFSHPLRTNVIYLDKSGAMRIRAESGSRNGYDQESQGSVSKEVVNETSKEEPKHYATLAK